MDNVTSLRPKRPTALELQQKLRRVQQVVRAVRVCADHEDTRTYPDALELCEEILDEIYDGVDGIRSAEEAQQP
jgi:hypothetical protein